MHVRQIFPVVLLLTSACAQVPTEPTDGVLGSAEPSASAQIASVTPAPAPVVAPPATRTPGAMAPASAPRRASPTLQDTGQIPSVTVAEPELPPKNLWVRVTNGFSMAPMDNALVREWENWYAKRPEYVARMIHRSSHFLFHIVEELEKRNMPMEIALLPMIESAFNPVAYSHAHASGMWQFIPSTGKDFGLRQNWWYDGRRDVIAATRAALDYLEKLHGMFGDWQLALASYNWGEGAVGRAVERNRAKGLPTDYESLTVPPETRNYIPKLIAVKNIISNPARYGLRIADIPNEPYFETVLVNRHIDMKLAAKLAEMSPEEFRFLNPGHNKPVIKAGGGELIVLPKNKTATFIANLAKHDTPLVSWKAVRLRPGEKVEHVAAQHGMTLAELKQANGLHSQKRLVAGQPLLVQIKGGADDPQLLDLPANPLASAKSAQAKKTAQANRTGKKTVAQKGKKPPVQQANAKKAKPVKAARSQQPANKKPQTDAERVDVASR